MGIFYCFTQVKTLIQFMPRRIQQTGKASTDKVTLGNKKKTSYIGFSSSVSGTLFLLLVSSLFLWKNVTSTPTCEDNYDQCVFLIDLLRKAISSSQNASDKVWSTFTEYSTGFHFPFIKDLHINGWNGCRVKDKGEWSNFKNTLLWVEKHRSY